MKYLLIILLSIPVITLIGSSKVSQPPENERYSSASDTIVKVALLQINPNGANVQENQKIGENYCKKAKSLGADIILFPELWSIGYSDFHMAGTNRSPEDYPLSFEKWKTAAVDLNSTYIRHFQKLAAELEVTIVISYLETRNGELRNSASVIDPKGNILMTYSKVHVCDFALQEVLCTPGDDFYVCDVPVRGDSIKLGVMICYDREFPESARILMVKGAELILTPNACRLGDLQINQFQTRAYENAVGVAMANYPQPFQNGHSCAFSANGREILVADAEEGIFIVPFNIKEIREYRKGTIWGDSFRRPQKYQSLTSPGFDSVFVRKNALGEKFEREKR